MGDIKIYSQLADLKEIDYKNTLAIASIIEILSEKGLLDKREIAQKAGELEALTLEEIEEMRAKR